MCVGFSMLFVVALMVSAQNASPQNRSVWVLRSSGEMVEYDAGSFAAKRTVKVPAQAMGPGSIAVNQAGQILFSSVVGLPLSEEDAKSPHKLWLWNGQTAATIDQGVERKQETTGSNDAITESAPQAYLAADGAHLYWFASRPRRLVRGGVELSTSATWQAWRTDLNGGGREEVASAKLPECKCKTGSCEETCPEITVWAPEEGIGNFFLTLQIVTGQVSTTYGTTTSYKNESGKWTTTALAEPLQRPLDSTIDGSVMVSAIPDTGCCGWSNESDDQTLLWVNGKKLTAFDERESYKNPDYDVSFYTRDAKLSPGSGYVAMTVIATAPGEKPIQLTEEGQANPEELKEIRKALVDLPALVVKGIGDEAKQVVFVPHAELLGWISEKEVLLVEDHALVALDVKTGTMRKTGVKVEDAGHVWVR
jgi:hypothetical protein